MADKQQAKLVLQLVDQVSGPAKAIKGELASITTLATNFGRSLGGASAAQARELTRVSQMMSGVAAPGGALGRAARDTTRQLAAVTAAMPRPVSSGVTDELAALSRGLATVVAPAAIAAGATASVRRFAEVELAIERIGITAGASATETKAAFGVLQRVAHDYAMTQDEVTAGLDVLVASGRDLKEALAFLPAVTATAQASGAATADIAATADAIGRNFGIAGADAQRAFDIIVEGGKAGQFELRDMANYLPSLAPSFAALGYEGEEGLKRMTAVLQALRAGSGSAEQAASAAMNVFSKIESEETVNRFKKFGLDLRREMADARKEGRDLLEVFVELTRETINGDLSKIPQLFGDQEMQVGMRALINNGRTFTDVMRALGQAAGSTGRDLARVLDTTDAKIAKLSTSWDRFVQSLGAAVSIAAVPVMETAANAINSEIDYSAGLAREEEAGGSFRESFAEFARQYRAIHGERWFDGAEVRNAYKVAMGAFGRGETESPYAGLEREAKRRRGEGGISREHRNALSGLDAAPSVDRARTTGRTPVPTPAPADRAAAPAAAPAMSEAEQRQSYAGGRQRADLAARGGRAGDRAVIESVNRIQAVQARIEASIAGFESATAERGGRVAPVAADFGQMTAEAASAATRIADAFAITADPTIAEPIRLEGALAAVAARQSGAEILAALSIVATPKVDASSIWSAKGAADALRSALNAVGNAVGSAASAYPISGPPKKAAGGAVRAGVTYLTGERGPELVHMGTNGYVTPNHRLPDGMAAGPSMGGAPVHFNQQNHFHGITEAVARRVAEESVSRFTSALHKGLNLSRRNSMTGRPFM